ncbi:MAG TPA: hypothetical protein VLW65_17925 [Bryobacteraceae bacterium]|nr:hypothetical protein [Bryobacteraceae bacterium]
MNGNKRPLSVTILAGLYVVVGAAGFVSGLGGFRARGAFPVDDVWVELVRLLAVVAGAFLLRGYNWARWLALAWMVFHVVLSAFHEWREFAVHCLICGAIAWVLLRPAAARYFRGARMD